MTASSRSSGTASTAWMPGNAVLASGTDGSCCTSSTATGARSMALRPRWVSPTLIRRSRNAATRSALMPKADLGTKTCSVVSNS